MGTYIGGFILKSEKVIDAHSETLERSFDEAIGQSRDFIKDISKTQPKVAEDVDLVIEKEPNPKSARERLKDKGLM